jgi:CRP-like cAMP-binding protein
MSDKDDLLGGLLGTRRAGKRDAQPVGTSSHGQDLAGFEPGRPEAATGSHHPPGLTPLDLLGLPAAQRKVINWLSRKKQAGLEEIGEAMGQDRAATERTLNDLIQAGYIHEALVNGEILYRVVFRGTVRRGPVGLPAEIWARVDLDHLTFLKQLSLFRGLSEDELREIANHLDERRYQRDEVILWQGNISEYVYLIKSGIVSIARYSAQNKDRKALAYLKQGDILGEYSSIMPEQGGVASATATAVTAVDVIMIRRADFYQLLVHHSSIAIELARILVQRLIATDSHFSSSMGSRLCLVISVGSESGATLLGNALALTLANATRKRTVYTEQPESHRLAGEFGVSPTLDVYGHPAGYDVLISTSYSGLLASVRATLVYEQLVTQYDNIVIGVPAWAEEIMSYLIGYADQIVVVSTPDPESQERLTKLSATLRTLVHPEKVALFYVLNRAQPAHSALAAPGRIDFDLPHVPEMPALTALSPDALPGAIAGFAGTLADRLGRTNQVSIYIPTTVDVNQSIDTTAYVERTLAFLGQRFGGATTNQARGVWNSAEAGLVGEDIHIVRSYATQADVDNHLQDVLDYMEQLKQELRQEAMALEINHKLLLI